MILKTSRCGWQWKDLGRFICLKIWPRLPKQSTRAIRISNSKGSIISQISQTDYCKYEKFVPVEKGIDNRNINYSNNIIKQTSYSGSDVFLPLPPNRYDAAPDSDDTTWYAHGPMNITK